MELEGGSAESEPVEPSVRRSRRLQSRSLQQLGHDESVMSVYAADPASRAEAMASEQKGMAGSRTG